MQNGLLIVGWCGLKAYAVKDQVEGLQPQTYPSLIPNPAMSMLNNPGHVACPSVLVPSFVRQ